MVTVYLGKGDFRRKYAVQEVVELFGRSSGSYKCQRKLPHRGAARVDTTMQGPARGVDSPGLNFCSKGLNLTIIWTDYCDNVSQLGLIFQHREFTATFASPSLSS
jgi:hypothetical protein